MTVVLGAHSGKDVASADPGKPQNLGCRQDGICYYTSSGYEFSKANWQDAVTACDNEDYMLPILNSQDHKDWFISNIIANYSADFSAMLWVMWIIYHISLFNNNVFGVYLSALVCACLCCEDLALCLCVSFQTGTQYLGRFASAKLDGRCP